jgi:hypothetical protein
VRDLDGDAIVAEFFEEACDIVTAMLQAAAKDVEDKSGVAARKSIAAAACEVLRRPMIRVRRPPSMVKLVQELRCFRRLDCQAAQERW